MNKAIIEKVRAKFPGKIILEVIPELVKASEVCGITEFSNHFRVTFNYEGKLRFAVVTREVVQKHILKWKKEIASREQWLDRVEDWECRDKDDLFSMAVYWRLVESRMKPEEKKRWEELANG